MAEGQEDARDRIARYLGVGRTTVEKAEAVIAPAEDAPEEYGYLVEQMDRSGNVASAHRRLQVERQARELAAAPPVLPEGPFGVIVADPPLALWLWTTNTTLPRAFEVATAWASSTRAS